VRESGGRSKTQPPLAVRGQCERGDLQLANPRRAPAPNGRDSITRARERVFSYSLDSAKAGPRPVFRAQCGGGEGALQKLSERRDSRPIRGIPRAFEPSPLNEPLAIETRLHTHGAELNIPFHEARVSNAQSCVSPRRARPECPYYIRGILNPRYTERTRALCRGGRRGGRGRAGETSRVVLRRARGMPRMPHV